MSGGLLSLLHFIFLQQQHKEVESRNNNGQTEKGGFIKRLSIIIG
jgi:hypothetical protein